ncbi:MAG: hypothetical protein U9Q89_10390 [Thermodesulfobacteriota bacterium]|nr:hypothetical protein [Thermodesulfobacteriota bacterium]
MQDEHSSAPLVSAGILSLLGAITLSIESYLTTQGLSLCTTAACKVVGHYIRVSEPVLISLGAGFFWLLSLLFFFAYRYPQPLSSIPLLFLYPSLAFDGVLIGFQYFTINQKCTLCISVASLLGLITLIYLLQWKNKTLLVCTLLIWAGGFTASGIIEMPEPVDAYNSMIFYQRQAEQITGKQAPKMTLIISMKCPHCFHVIAYLARQNTSGIIWRLASIDHDSASLKRLSSFLAQAPHTDTPFALLKEIETKPAPSAAKITKALRINTKKARTFLANIDTSSIPLLFVESSADKKIIIGSQHIINFLQQLLPGKNNTHQGPYQ